MTKESLTFSNNSPDSNRSEDHERARSEDSFDASFISPVGERMMTTSLNMDVLPSTNQVLWNPFNSSNLYDFNHENIASEIMMDFVNSSSTDTYTPHYLTRNMSPASFELSTENGINTISLLEDVPNETSSSGYFSESYSELEGMDIVPSDPLQNDHPTTNADDKLINSSLFEEHNNQIAFEMSHRNEPKEETNAFRENITDGGMNYVNPFAHFKGFYPRINRNVYDPQVQTTILEGNNHSDKISVINDLEGEQYLLIQSGKEQNLTVQTPENDSSKYSRGLFQLSVQNLNKCETNTSSDRFRANPFFSKKEKLHSENESSDKNNDRSILASDMSEQSASEERDFFVEHEINSLGNAGNTNAQENANTFASVKFANYLLSPVYQRNNSEILKTAHSSQNEMHLKEESSIHNLKEFNPMIKQNVNSTVNEFEENHDLQNQQNTNENKPEPYILPTSIFEQIISPPNFDGIYNVDIETKENEELDTKNTTKVPLGMLRSNDYYVNEVTMCNHEILLAIVKSFFTSNDILEQHKEQEISTETKNTDNKNHLYEPVYVTENKPKDISKGLRNDHNYFNNSEDTKARLSKRAFEERDEVDNGLQNTLFPFRGPFSADQEHIEDCTYTLHNKEKLAEVVKSITNSQEMDDRDMNEFQKTDANKTIFKEIDSRSIKTNMLVANTYDQPKPLQTESLRFDEHQESLRHRVNDLEMSNTLGESEEVLAAEIVKTELSGIENSNFFDEQSPVVGDIFDFLKRLDSCIDFNSFDDVFSTQLNTQQPSVEFQEESLRHSVGEFTSSPSECVRTLKEPHQQSEVKLNPVEREPHPYLELINGIQEEDIQISKDEQLQNCINLIQQPASPDNQETNYGSCFNLLQPIITNNLRPSNEVTSFDALFYTTLTSNKNEIAVEQNTIEVKNMQPYCDQLNTMRSDFQNEKSSTANPIENFQEFQADPHIKTGKQECASLPKLKNGIQSIKLIVPREYNQNHQIKSLNIKTERKENDSSCLRTYLDCGTKSNSKEGRGSVISYFSKAAGLISTTSTQKIETDNAIEKQEGYKKAENVKLRSSKNETKQSLENQFNPMLLHKIPESSDRHTETLTNVFINTDQKPRNVTQAPRSKRQCLTPGYINPVLPGSTILSPKPEVLKKLGSEIIPSQVVEVAQIVDNYAAKFQNSTAMYPSPEKCEFGPKRFHPKAARPQNIVSNTILKSSLEKREPVRRTNRRKTTVADCTSAIQEMKNGQGSTVLDIMGYVRGHIPSENSNKSHDGRKRMKDASETGNIELKSGRYMVALNSTSTKSSRPKTIKRKLNNIIEDVGKVKTKKTNATPKVTQPRRTKSVRFCKKTNDKRKDDPSL